MLAPNANVLAGVNAPEIKVLLPIPEENATLRTGSKFETDQEECDYLFRQMYLFLRLID